MDSSVAPLATQSLLFLAVFFVTTAVLTGKAAVVRATSALLGVLALIYALLPAPADSAFWLLRGTTGIGALLLLALALQPATWTQRRRESIPRHATSTALFIAALAGFVVPWLGPSDSLPTGAASLPVLEPLVLGFLLGARHRRGHLIVAAAVPPLLLLGTGRFGLLGGGELTRGLCLAGFALGLSALLPGPRVRPENEGPEQVTDLRDKLMWRRAPGWIAWSAAGLSLALGLVLAGWSAHQELGETTSRALQQTAASALVLALASAVFAARFAAWTSPPFRYLAWRATRSLGTSSAWLRAGAHGWLLALGVVGAVIAVGEPLIGDYRDAMRATITEDLELLGLLAILVLILRATYLVRRRIFVPDFAGEEVVGKATAAALASCLRHELASIAAVHRTIDEALPSSDGRMPKLEVTVEDVGASLEATVGALPVPTKWTNVVPSLLRATGLLRGPHLTGRFDRKESALILTVELSGGGRKGSWQVSVSTTEGRDESTLAFRMVRQMAYRIAAALAPLGSPRWEAVRSFTEGLRAYRKVRLTERDRDRELRVAEQCFREALQYDNTFNQGHYNLGVVYSRLGEHDAALAVFRQAIAAEPSSYSAHLAVAMAYFDRAEDLFFRGAYADAVREDFLQARVFAARAIALAPSEPRPWNVYGAATICWAWRGMAPPDVPSETWTDEKRQAVEALHVASALAWRRLCRCELSGDPSAIGEAKFVTTICLENLAECYREGGQVEESLAVLAEALSLAPRKPSLRLALGKSLALRNTSESEAEPGPAVLERRRARLIEAENEFYDVHGDGLSMAQRAGRWAWLLALHLELGKLARQTGPRASVRRQMEGVDRALRAALDCAAPGEDLVLTPARQRDREDPQASALRHGKQLDLLRGELHRSSLPRTELFGRDESGAVAAWPLLEKRLKVLDRVQKAETSGQHGCDRTGGPEQGDRSTPWANAQWEVHRARELLASDPDEAVRLLEHALAVLRRRHTRQVRDQGLDTLLARAYLASASFPNASDGAGREARDVPADRPDRLHRALDYAFRGVAAKPESAIRREVLAEVFDTLRDHVMGDAERRAALSLASPPALLEDPAQLRALYRIWRRRIKESHKPETLVKEAIAFFEHLRDLLESAPIPAPEPKRGGPRALPFEAHAAIHQYLGLLQRLDSKKQDESKANLIVAQANGYGAAHSAGGR